MSAPPKNTGPQKPSRPRDDAANITQPTLGLLGWARWAWRQLTSMRTALFLLLLLAVAAVPGSLFPQRSLDAARVAQYLDDHPGIGVWLDRLSLFDVFTSPWFSAIYLLLVLSLIGCIVPRSRQLWREVRAVPPRAPAHPARLRHGRIVPLTTDTASAELLDRASRELRARRFRVHSHDDTSVSAEKGYLREAGNIVFHVGLCAVIVGVAVGYLHGWRGDVIVPEGERFTSTVAAYDTISTGPLVDVEQLPPFQLRVDKFVAIFEDKLATQLGMPREFTAYTTITDRLGATPRAETISVNHPAAVDGATVFLLGNGYAPLVTVRDAAGQVLYRQVTPFLPRDDDYLSVGAIKVTALPAAKQLGFSGVFVPTADPIDPEQPRSVFPDLRDPRLTLTVWEGELSPGGRPQNVYSLDTAAMKELTGEDGKAIVLRLRPGDTVALPGGRGSITMEKVVRFAGLSVREDPATMFVLVSSLFTVAGLMATLLVRRRRVFVRVGSAAGTDPAAAAPAGALEIGGLAKTEDAGLAHLIDALADALTGPRASAGTRPAGQQAAR